jgi:hypothetical protein
MSIAPSVPSSQQPAQEISPSFASFMFHAPLESNFYAQANHSRTWSKTQGVWPTDASLLLAHAVHWPEDLKLSPPPDGWLPSKCGWAPNFGRAPNPHPQQHQRDDKPLVLYLLRNARLSQSYVTYRYQMQRKLRYLIEYRPTLCAGTLPWGQTVALPLCASFGL